MTWQGWRVLPYGRVAHLLTWAIGGDRHRYTSACGRVFIVSHVVDHSAAKHCKRCEAIELAILSTIEEAARRCETDNDRRIYSARDAAAVIREMATAPIEEDDHE